MILQTPHHRHHHPPPGHVCRCLQGCEIRSGQTSAHKTVEKQWKKPQKKTWLAVFRESLVRKPYPSSNRTPYVAKTHPQSLFPALDPSTDWAPTHLGELRMIFWFPGLQEAKVKGYGHVLASHCVVEVLESFTRNFWHGQHRQHWPWKTWTSTSFPQECKKSPVIAHCPPTFARSLLKAALLSLYSVSLSCMTCLQFLRPNVFLTTHDTSVIHLHVNYQVQLLCLSFQD